MEEVEQFEKKRLMWVAQPEQEEVVELLLEPHAATGH
jgi:hypothetical protein